MEAAGELVVDAAARHFLESGFHHGEQMLFFGLLIALEKQINGRGVRKFWRAAEAAIFDVEKLRDGLDLSVYNTGIKLRARAGESFRLSDPFGERSGGTLELDPFVAKGIGYGKKNSAEARAAHLIFGREVRSTEKGLAVRQQKAGKRPASLAGNGADGGLIARIDVGALVAINLHGDKMLVDDFGNFDVFVAFAVNDVTPVAPHRADVEEDGFVFRFGALEGVIAPFMPVNGLMRCGAQVRTGGILQAVRALVSQGGSLEKKMPG